MAVPTDIHEQIARMQDRLRLMSPDQTPPPEHVREQVRTWQDHLRAAAEALRWADQTIEQLAALPVTGERDQLLAAVRASRAQAFTLIQRLNPEQTWFWTEEWQAGEREVDREIAAGLLITGTPEAFDAALEAVDREPG
jgi:RecB family exonuclease